MSLCTYLGRYAHCPAVVVPRQRGGTCEVGSSSRPRPIERINYGTTRWIPEHTCIFLDRLRLGSRWGSFILRWTGRWTLAVRYLRDQHWNSQFILLTLAPWQYFEVQQYAFLLYNSSVKRYTWLALLDFRFLVRRQQQFMPSVCTTACYSTETICVHALSLRLAGSPFSGVSRGSPKRRPRPPVEGIIACLQTTDRL